MSIIKDDLKIACEIAVSNSVEYEVKNIQKCLNAGYSFVCVVSKDEMHLENIKEKVLTQIENQQNIRFFNPSQMTEFFDSRVKNVEKEIKRIKGYRVNVNYVFAETKEP